MKTKDCENFCFSFCIATTTQLTISAYQNVLTTSSPLYARVNQSTNTYYYQSMYVLVDEAGNYTFQSNSSVDLFGSLYNNSFTAANPSVNLIAFDDDSGAIFLNFKITALLQTGVAYVLVVTTSSSNTTGSFTITASSLGEVIYVPISITITSTSTIATTPITTSLIVTSTSSTYTSITTTNTVTTTTTSEHC
jgi:hypothetical protein